MRGTGAVARVRVRVRVRGRGGGPGVQVDRPGQGRRAEIGDPGDGGRAPERGGATGQTGGGDERAHAQCARCAARPAARAVSRSLPWATVATSAAWAAGQAWLPTPRKSAAAANSPLFPRGWPGAARRPPRGPASTPPRPCCGRPGPATGPPRACTRDRPRRRRSWRRRSPARTVQDRHPVEQQGRAGAGRCRARPPPGRRRSGGLRRHGRGRGGRRPVVVVMAPNDAVDTRSGTSVDVIRQPTPAPPGGAVIK